MTLTVVATSATATTTTTTVAAAIAATASAYQVHNSAHLLCTDRGRTDAVPAAALTTHRGVGCPAPSLVAAVCTQAVTRVATATRQRFHGLGIGHGGGAVNVYNMRLMGSVAGRRQGSHNVVDNPISPHVTTVARVGARPPCLG